MFLEFTNADWEPCTDEGNAVCVDSTTGYEVLGETERIIQVLRTEDTYWTDLLAIVGIGAGWMLFGILVAVYKSNQSTTVYSPEEAPKLKTDKDVPALSEKQHDEEAGGDVDEDKNSKVSNA